MSEDKYSRLKQKILCLLQDREEVTRSSLLAELFIQRGTLAKILSQMHGQGMIEEPDRKGRNAGRRESRILLHRDYQYFLGLSIDPDRVASVVVDSRQNIIAQRCEKAGRAQTPQLLTEKLNAQIGELRTEAANVWEKLAAVGFSDPGCVDFENTVSVDAVRIPGWKGINMRNHLRPNTPCPVFVFPGKICRAWAEYKARNDDAAQMQLVVHLGTGVGAGYIINGEPYYGASSYETEIGHIVVSENGPMCACGSRGCLEACVGYEGLRQKVAAIIDQGVPTLLGKGAFTFPSFVQCVRQKDKVALSLAAEVVEQVGKVLAVVICTLNPSRIVFTGELADLGDILLDALWRKIELLCPAGSLRELSMDISTLPDCAWAWGAARLAQKEQSRFPN